MVRNSEVAGTVAGMTQRSLFDLRYYTIAIVAIALSLGLLSGRGEVRAAPSAPAACSDSVAMNSCGMIQLFRSDLLVNPTINQNAVVLSRVAEGEHSLFGSLPRFVVELLLVIEATETRLTAVVPVAAM